MIIRGVLESKQQKSFEEGIHALDDFNVSQELITPHGGIAFDEGRQEVLLIETYDGETEYLYLTYKDILSSEVLTRWGMLQKQILRI